MPFFYKIDKTPYLMLQNHSTNLVKDSITVEFLYWSCQNLSAPNSFIRHENTFQISSGFPKSEIDL